MRCPTWGAAALTRQKSAKGGDAPRRPAEEHGRAGALECMLRLRGGGGFNTDDIWAQMDRAAKGEDIEDDDNHPDKSRGKDSVKKAAPKRKRGPPSPQESDTGSQKQPDEATEKEWKLGHDADRPVGQQTARGSVGGTATAEGDMSVDTMAALLQNFQGGDKPPEAFKTPQV